LRSTPATGAAVFSSDPFAQAGRSVVRVFLFYCIMATRGRAGRHDIEFFDSDGWNLRLERPPPEEDRFAFMSSAPDPEEFSDEEARLAARLEGRVFWEHRVTKEMTRQLPVAIAPCRRCFVAMACRRCNNDGQRLCMDCYLLESGRTTATRHKVGARPAPQRGRLAVKRVMGVRSLSLARALAPSFHRSISWFRQGHSWSKVPVQGLRCQVCRSVATILCYECSDDAYCSRCCGAIHAKRKLRGHTRFFHLTQAPHH
jgi:hypothetical protein